MRSIRTVLAAAVMVAATGCASVLTPVRAFIDPVYRPLKKGDERPLWLAVGPPSLLCEIEPLAQRRRSQGMETMVVTGTVADALSEAPRTPG